MSVKRGFLLGVCASLLTVSATASSILQNELSIGGGVPTYDGGGYDVALFLQLDAKLKASNNVELLVVLNSEAVGYDYGYYSYMTAVGTSSFGVALHASINSNSTFFVSGLLGRLAVSASEYDYGSLSNEWSAEGLAYRVGAGLSARQNALSSRFTVERRGWALDQAEPYAEGWVSSQLAVHPTRKLKIGLNSGFNFAFSSSYLGAHIGLTF